MSTAKVDYLTRDKLAWLLATQALIILPLLFFLPTWLLLVWGIVAYWRIQMYLGRWGAPGFALKGAVVAICALGILLSFRGRLGTETMVALLLSAFVLKLLEVKSNRDAQWLVMIGFITCATQLLFNQSPLAALYCLACCWLLIASWRATHLSHPQAFGIGLKRSGALLLHSLPVMLVLFVVLPRLGPLWAIPNQQAAKTGFSDSLSPGDLGELVKSQATAFRVEFAGEPPAAAQLYWRGLVLNNFDGRRWQLRDAWSSGSNNQQAILEQPVDYSIIIEPHGQHWLFGLMTPTQLDTQGVRSWITPDQLLMTRRPLTQRLRYQVTSALVARYSEPAQLSRTEHLAKTRFPAEVNPRTQALAAEWRAQGLDEQALIARALALFNREFTYTLRPPLLGQHSVDEFLFDTKRGFCEHFASSFALLLRAAGVPARVVVGYQGGTWNQLENYLLVRQSDAHAWVEVWSEQRGWYLIDPTAAVAPNRIEQGLDDALSEEEKGLVQSPWSGSEFLWRLQMQWDAATYLWQRWVLSYDEEAQEGLLRRWLGGSEPWRIALWLIGAGLVAAALFAWLMSHRRQLHPLRPEARLMLKLERKLAGRGFKRAPGEAPGAFLQRVGTQVSGLQQPLAEIYQHYEAIAYREQQVLLEPLKRLIQKL